MKTIFRQKREFFFPRAILLVWEVKDWVRITQVYYNLTCFENDKNIATYLPMIWVSFLRNQMAVEPVFGPFEFRAEISYMGRWRRTPLSASVVFTVIKNRFSTFRTVPAYFIFKELHQVSAGAAWNFKNRIKSPFPSVISCAFSHLLILPAWQTYNVQVP